MHQNTPDERKAVVQELQNGNEKATDGDDADSKNWKHVVNDALEADERKVMKMVKNVFADYFTVDAFDGMVANLKHGSLGLVKTGTVKTETGEMIEDKRPKVELDEKKPMVEHKFVEVAVPTSA